MRGKWGHLGYANIRVERKEYRNVEDALAGREVVRRRDVREVIQVGEGEVEHSEARRKFGTSADSLRFRAFTDCAGALPALSSPCQPGLCLISAPC